MSEHGASVHFLRGDQPFKDNRYSRVHEWRFDGGAVVRASSSPHVVRPPMSDPTAIDPEEGFIASLASCHMLWFLSLAAERGFVVDAYDDDARGTMGNLDDGRPALVLVALRPKVTFAPGDAPTGEALAALHRDAHRQCFLANAVKCELRIEPR